jgi:hypothetical protein
MSVTLSYFAGAGWQFFSNDGVPLAGGKIYSYIAGTSTLSPTYTTSAGNIANSNPIILDSAGRTPQEVWLTSGQLYKFILRDAADTLIGTYDNIPSINDFANLANTTNPALGDALVGFRQSNSAGNITGAVGKTVHQKFQEYVSVKDFGATGDGVTNDYAAINAAWLYCYPIGASLYFPTGTYLVVTDNFPFRNTQLPVTSLLDCNNMTIYGDGPSTILKTSSVLGADVLQLNGLKNFHVRNMMIQSVISGSDAGSNAISVTGGWDNLTFYNVWMKNLAYVDKVTYVDGGKALSIQPPSEANPILMGSLKATNIIADGCVYGFGYEPDNDLALTQPVNIDVDIKVMNSRQGIVFSAPAATSALPTHKTNGVRVRGQSINNWQDVVAGRCFGIDVDMQIITTKTQLQLLLSYNGTAWSSADGIADCIALICTYAKNSRFNVYGNKKNCRHKAKIGGASEGSSGFNGATEWTDFYLDITGTSDGVDVQFNDYGGNIMNNSRLYVTTSTAITLPIEFYAPSLDNTITIGPDLRQQSLSVTGEVAWTEADGRTVRHNMFLQSSILTAKQTIGASPDLLIQQWVSDAGAPKFGIRNDGAFSTAYGATATAVATVSKVLPLYDMAGATIGYIPIYATYTP